MALTSAVSANLHLIVMAWIWTDGQRYELISAYFNGKVTQLFCSCREKKQWKEM